MRPNGCRVGAPSEPGGPPTLRTNFPRSVAWSASIRTIDGDGHGSVHRAPVSAAIRLIARACAMTSLRSTRPVQRRVVGSGRDDLLHPFGHTRQQRRDHGRLELAVVILPGGTVVVHRAGCGERVEHCAHGPVTTNLQIRRGRRSAGPR